MMAKHKSGLSAAQELAVMAMAFGVPLGLATGGLQGFRCSRPDCLEPVRHAHCEDCGVIVKHQYRVCKECKYKRKAAALAPLCPKSTGESSSCDEGCAINGCADYVDGLKDHEPRQVDERGE